MELLVDENPCMEINSGIVPFDFERMQWHSTSCILKLMQFDCERTRLIYERT